MAAVFRISTTVATVPRAGSSRPSAAAISSAMMKGSIRKARVAGAPGLFDIRARYANRRNPSSLRAYLQATLSRHTPETLLVNLYVAIGPLIALIAGILILIVPRLLNYIVAIYLIVIGLLGLFGGRLLS